MKFNIKGELNNIKSPSKYFKALVHPYNLTYTKKVDSLCQKNSKHGGIDAP